MRLECPENGCNDNCLKEIAHRILDRILDHAERDSSSHLFKHPVGSGHPDLDRNDYKLIG